MIPPHKLDEVEEFVSFILTRKKIKAKGVVKLGGIWEGRGFEKLNINKELKSLRNDFSKAILKQSANRPITM